MNKICLTCSRTVPIENFSLRSKGKGRLPLRHSSCDKCYKKLHNEYKRERARKDRESRNKAPEGFKTCKTCKTDKPKTIEYFQKISTGTGLAATCKECVKTKATIKWHQKNPPKPMLPEGFKYCKSCDQTLSFILFRKIKKNYYYQCIDCEKAWDKAHPRKKISRTKKPLIRTTSPTLTRSEKKNFQKKLKERHRRLGVFLVKPLKTLISTMRSRLRTALKSKKLKKDDKTLEIIGCTIPELMDHLESRFKPGMTWSNHGFGNDCWHIDHIIPFASAKDLEDLYKIAHYTNLQPLWQFENLSKGNKMPLVKSS